MNEHGHDDADEPRIPARLAAELKELYAPRRLVPPQVDDSVLGKARRFLTNMRGLRPVIRFPQWLAAAAVVALAALIGSLLFPSKQAASLVREDINRDGRVDVLDAFALARKLQAGAADNPGLDCNSDGVVDQKDVDAVAARAVKVEKGRG